MRTKKTKRFLAALLAMVMVLSTFVAMPFSSYASTYTLEQLNTLMSQYESKMKSGTVYENLTDAYEAWHNAYLVSVGVKAGIVSESEIDSVYTALNDEITQMTPWSAKTVTSKVPSFVKNSDTISADYYNNILYTEAGTSNVAADFTTTQYLNVEVYYPTTVLLYDGVNAPVMGVHFAGYSERVGTSAPRYVYSVYPSEGEGKSGDSADFAMIGNWKGQASGTNNLNDALDWSWAIMTGTGKSIGHNSTTGICSDLFERRGLTSGSAKNYYKGYGGGLKFKGTLADNVYTQAFYPNWRYYAGSTTTVTWTDANLAGINANATTPIYVVNYNAVKQALSNVFTDLKSINITDSSYATVTALLSAIETAQNLDPGTWFANSTSSTVTADVSEVNKTISGAVNGITNAKNALASINKASYLTLAGYYSDYADVYNGKNSDGFWDNSEGKYDTFTAEYEAAGTILNAVAVNKTQKMSDASADATDLYNARQALTPAETYIDDTELQALFTQYYGLTQSYYTTETYNNLTAKINAALVYYNNNNYSSGITLKDDAAGRATYTTILNDVKAAMAALRISRDAIAAVDGELISYNSLMERANAVDGTKYANYNEVMATVGQASVTIVALEKTDFTDEASMISQYVAVLQPAYEALNSLYTGFMAIEDGTIVSATYGSTSGYSADNIKTYLSNQILEITYFKTKSGQRTYVTEYDYTVDNTYYKNAGYRGAQFHGLGFGAYNQASVSNAYGLIAINWKEGGCAAQSSEGVNNGIYTLGTYQEGLMKTPSGGSNPYVKGSNYINVVANTKDQKILGETKTVCKDIGVNMATFKTPDVYELIFVYDVEKQRTNTDVVQTVNVIDISDLFEAVETADGLVSKYQSNAFGCFDATSWSTFTEALKAAKDQMEYTAMSNTDIVTACQSRYNNLVAAMAPIQDKSALNETAEGAHNLVEQADTVHATCTEDGTIHYICGICGYDTTVTEAALDHDYAVTPNNDGATHTLTCVRNDASYVENCTPDETGTVCAVCKQSLYDPADWTEFNAAKADMEAALLASANGTIKFTIAALTQANTDIAAISFYNYDDTAKAAVSEARQSEVDAQAELIVAAYNALMNGIADSSVYDANISKASTLNADAYNVTAVQEAVSGVEVSQPVTVNGGEYTGYDFDDYNTRFGTALNENWIPYTVTVYDYNDAAWYLTQTGSTFGYTDDAAAATQFHYGDYVTAPNPNNAEETCAWAVNVETPNSSSSAPDLVPKYMLTDVDYIFNIRGNTTLWTTSDATSEANSTYEIKFVLALDGVNTGKVLDVQYVNQGKGIKVSACNLPENIPFYSIDTGSDGTTTYNLKRANTTITPSSNIVIVANYVSDSRGTYTITLIDEAGTTLEVQENVTFNNLVTLSAPGAAAYVNAENGRTLCIGSTYSFYACRDITVKAVTTAPTKGDVDVISTPVIDSNGIVYLVGSFALPEGCTIQSYGIVLDGLGAKTNLSLADLNKANYVFNLSASKYTCDTQRGNQFTVSFNQNSMFSQGNYVAYAIYTDENGLTQYVYSDVIVGAAIYR